VLGYQIHFHLSSSKFFNFCFLWRFFMLGIIIQLIVFTTLGCFRVVLIVGVNFRFSSFVFFIDEEISFNVSAVNNSLKALWGFKFLSIGNVSDGWNDWVNSEINGVCDVSLHNLRWNAKVFMAALWNTLDLKSIFSVNHVMSDTFSANLAVNSFLALDFL